MYSVRNIKNISSSNKGRAKDPEIHDTHYSETTNPKPVKK